MQARRAAFFSVFCTGAAPPMRGWGPGVLECPPVCASFVELARLFASIGKKLHPHKGFKKSLPTDCKSAGLRLRRFESYLSHHPEIATPSKPSAVIFGQFEFTI
jgi:hypothetical protein